MLKKVQLHPVHNTSTMMSSVSILLVVLTSCMLFCTDAGTCTCPDGFHGYESSCYWFSRIQGDFGFARSVCEHLGGHLAIITNGSEDTFVREHARSENGVQYYLGASDLGFEGVWRWEDGYPLIYTNWGAPEPNNIGNTEHCLTLYRNLEYRWNDEDCTHDLNFICKRSM